MNTDTNTKELNSPSECISQKKNDMQGPSKECTDMVVYNNVEDSKASEKDKTFYSVNLTETEELKTLSNYADKKKEHLQNLSIECSEMGFWSSVKDTMVPEEDRKWYRFFTSKKADKAVILEKAQIYRTFYEEVRNAFIIETSSGPVNCESFREKINQLKTKVQKEYEAAKSEIKQTSSKLVYNMHQTFISEYEKLNWFIRDVETAALSEMLKVAESGWKRALDDIAVLNAKLTEITEKMTELTKSNINLSDSNKDLSKKYDAVKKTCDTSLANQNILLQQNKEMKEAMDEIREYMKKQNSPPTEE